MKCQEHKHSKSKVKILETTKISHYQIQTQTHSTHSNSGDFQVSASLQKKWNIL